MIRLLLIILIIFSLSVNANTLEIFGMYIKIPEKFKLKVSISMKNKYKKIEYFSGDFMNLKENEVIEIIQVGKINDYVMLSQLDNIKDFGDIIVHENFNELITEVNTVNIGRHIYHRKFYFDKNYYLSYMITNLKDIDRKLR